MKSTRTNKMLSSTKSLSVAQMLLQNIHRKACYLGYALSLFLMLIASNHAQAQCENMYLYNDENNFNNGWLSYFKSLNTSNNTVQNLPTTGLSQLLYNTLAVDPKHNAYLSNWAVPGGSIYKYTPGTGWSLLTAKPFTNVGSLAHDGTYLYAIAGDTGDLSRYNFSTGTWATLASISATDPSWQSHAIKSVCTGTHIFVANRSAQTKVYKYTIATNTWTVITAPASMASPSLSHNGPNLYMLGPGSSLHEYNIATNTWTTKAAYPGPGSNYYYYMQMAGLNFNTLYSVDKEPIFSGGTTDAHIYKYDIPSNSWSSVITIPGAQFANPAFIEHTPVIAPVCPILSCGQCLTADLSLTVSPNTDTKNKGETITYVYTLSNAGPDDAPTAKAKIKIPANTTFLSANPSQGTYTQSNGVWNVGNVANGTSKTLTVNVRVN
jgi:uncharacterized repeat protein (TIGR01451 family)